MIRLMTLEDIPACVKICEKNFKQLGYSYDTKKEFESMFYVQNYIRPLFYVWDDGIIKGVAGFNPCGWDDSVFGICTCYVDPEYHNQGIGRALTQHRLDEIKKMGGEIIFSTTKQIWHLQRFGFEVIKSPYTEWSVMQLIISH